jgi:hypothetical protein
VLIVWPHGWVLVLLALFFWLLSSPISLLAKIHKSSVFNSLNEPPAPSQENNRIEVRQALVYDFLAGMLLDVDAVLLLPRVRLA